MQTPVSVKIQDLQGRMVKSFTITRAGSALWDGKDAGGRPVPFGTYFVRATDGNLSSIQRITFLP
jgi:flagellar hook assembly protein FlgD